MTDDEDHPQWAQSQRLRKLVLAAADGLIAALILLALVAKIDL